MDNGLFSNKNILIPFDVIVNVDLGILYTMKELFPDSIYLDYSIYENEENRIIYYILNRKHENVLSLVIKNKYKENMESLLEEMYNKYYDKILNNSKYTDIISIIIASSKIQSLRINIYCKNQLEEHYIRTKTSFIGCKLNSVVNKNIEDINLDEYDTIFINKITQLKNIISKFKYKHIYLYKARYNLILTEYGFELPDYIENPELINLVSPYIMDESFFING